MSDTLLTFLTFTAAILAFLGMCSLVVDLVLRDRSKVLSRLDEEARKRIQSHIRKTTIQREADPKREKTKNGQAMSPSYQLRLRRLLDQADLNITIGQLLAIVAASGLIVGALGGISFESIMIGVFFFVVAVVISLAYVHNRRNRQREKILSQLPDALDLIARVIRAGQTMEQAMQAVASEFQPPISTEFAYCHEQENLGMSPEVSLRDLEQRTGLLEMKIFVMAVLVQRQIGGNLATILENLAAVVRERFRVRGKIKVLTAEGRLQANVLLVLPPLMVLAMTALNRSYVETLFSHPRPLIAALVGMAIGAWWIRRIVRFAI